MKRYMSIILLGLIIFNGTNTVSSWTGTENNEYPLFPVEDVPTIDGVIDSGEWDVKSVTERLHQVVYSEGSISEIEFTFKAIINFENIYLQITVSASSINMQNNSLGIAIGEGEIDKMSDTLDRKVIYVNGDQVETFDLWNCLNIDRDFCSSDLALVQPGVLDTSNEITAAFNSDEDNMSYEIKFPHTPSNSTEDEEIIAGTSIQLLFNPFGNIIDENQGHGALATSELIVTIGEPSESFLSFLDIFYILSSFLVMTTIIQRGKFMGKFEN